MPTKILHINNGGGFADHIEIATGTTVGQLCHARIPSGKAENHLIRVDRQPAAAGDVPLDCDTMLNLLVGESPIDATGAQR